MRWKRSCDWLRRTWKTVKKDGRRKMIHDQELQDWLDKCPRHDHEILHSDEDGVVIVFRFNNQREEE